MIKAATELCDKVIVVLNTANTMETGFIESEEIDGALLVGITGISGVNGLINVLRGEKEEPVPELDADGNVKYNEDGTPVYKTDASGKVITEKKLVSPSGRTVDTYAYDIIGTTPSAVNQGNKGNGEVGRSEEHTSELQSTVRPKTIRVLKLMWIIRKEYTSAISGLKPPTRKAIGRALIINTAKVTTA